MICVVTCGSKFRIMIHIIMSIWDPGLMSQKDIASRFPVSDLAH